MLPTEETGWLYFNELLRWLNLRETSRRNPTGKIPNSVTDISGQSVTSNTAGFGRYPNNTDTNWLDFLKETLEKWFWTLNMFLQKGTWGHRIVYVLWWMWVNLKVFWDPELLFLSRWMARLSEYICFSGAMQLLLIFICPSEKGWVVRDDVNEFE